MADDVAREFARLDPIRSVSEMMREVAALPDNLRRTVILRGLARSRTQYTWSFLACQHGIPEADWPPNPHDVTPAP